MIVGFNHTSFTVTDLDRSVRFWTEALGFDAASVGPRVGDWQERVTGVPGASIRVAHLYGHGSHIELIQYVSGAREAPRIEPSMACAAHVCFDVTDIAAMWDRLVGAGAEPQGEIALVDNGPVRGLKAGYLRDPGGIIIELVETPPQDGQAPA